MGTALTLLVLALVIAWWVRRWPLAQCRRCKGKGKFVRGRTARRCPDCGGSGYRLRWLIKMFGGKK
jgi:anaerobic ribonucleoside-triphosphate reductase